VKPITGLIVVDATGKHVGTVDGAPDTFSLIFALRVNGRNALLAVDYAAS
jgi:hypothetical protein